MGMGAVKIDVAGEPQSLWGGMPGPIKRTSADRYCRQIRIIADEGNAGDVIIGSDENVVAAAGDTRRGDTPLSAGEVFQITVGPDEWIDLDTLYIDVTTSGDHVRWISYDTVVQIGTATLKR